MIIWLASYPKSGNTLMRSILSSYFYSKDGNFEFKNLNQIKQFPMSVDFMSLGIHRLWKRTMLNMMNPSYKQKLIDVACGTGDMAQLFKKNVDELCQITCVDPNKGMINKGKQKLGKYKNLNWIIASAEKIPVASLVVDYFVLNFQKYKIQD